MSQALGAMLSTECKKKKGKGVGEKTASLFLEAL